jgi:hypothetical protein
MPMNDTVEQIQEFVAYARTLKDYEKGEAQVFSDLLFKAFDHGGYKEAGATPTAWKNPSGTGL